MLSVNYRTKLCATPIQCSITDVGNIDGLNYSSIRTTAVSFYVGMCICVFVLKHVCTSRRCVIKSNQMHTRSPLCARTCFIKCDLALHRAAVFVDAATLMHFATSAAVRVRQHNHRVSHLLLLLLHRKAFAWHICQVDCALRRYIDVDTYVA